MHESDTDLLSVQLSTALPRDTVAGLAESLVYRALTIGEFMDDVSRATRSSE